MVQMSVSSLKEAANVTGGDGKKITTVRSNI